MQWLKYNHMLLAHFDVVTVHMYIIIAHVHLIIM